MPTTALGRYEVVITALDEPGATELCSKPISFFPVLRIAGLALLAVALLAAALRPWRNWRNPSARWIGLPPVLGVLAFLYMPELGGMRGTLAPVVLAEMCGLSLSLLLVTRFAKRRRTVASVLILLVNGICLFLACILAHGTTWWVSFILPSLGGSLLWSLPSLLGLIAVRRQFSGRRLAAGLAICWAVIAAVTVGVISVVMEWPFYFIIIPVALSGVPYLVGWHAFVARNGFVRAALSRTFGLGGCADSESSDGPVSSGGN